MKILVVGGAGYIGGHLSDLLLRSGHDITVYDNLMFETRYLKDINLSIIKILNILYLEHIYFTS